MQVFSTGTQGEWREAASSTDGKPGPEEQEARRVLSDLFRCNNLVVLAGLGTSMCVKDVVSGKLLAPTMADLWTSVKGTVAKKGTANWGELMTLVKQPEGDENLESLLSRCRLAESFLDGKQQEKVQLLISTAESDIRDKVDFLKPGQQLGTHLEFLRRVARRSNRKSRAKVFTTNYDRCFEEAGRQGRYVVIDGFSQTQPPTFDSVNFSYDIVRRDRDSDTMDFIPNVFHLYKVHGSIDWERDSTSGEVRKVHKTMNPLLIYPRSSKYEMAFAQPYLEMMSALQASLREPNTGLLVVGFGFNDNHLSEPILSAIRSNLSLKTVVVSPRLASWQKGVEGPLFPGECETNSHLGRFAAFIGDGDARLAMLNCGFNELVQYIPDIVAESDLEKHLDRVRRLEVR